MTDPSLRASVDGVAGTRVSCEEHGFRRLSRLDSRIRNQFDLITSRTGWLLASHAFLLTALAATLNASGSAHPSGPQAAMRGMILLALPTIGATSSLLVWRAVIAAYAIVATVKGLRTLRGASDR